MQCEECEIWISDYRIADEHIRKFGHRVRALSQQQINGAPFGSRMTSRIPPQPQNPRQQPPAPPPGFTSPHRFEGYGQRQSVPSDPGRPAVPAQPEPGAFSSIQSFKNLPTSEYTKHPSTGLICCHVCPNAVWLDRDAFKIHHSTECHKENKTSWKENYKRLKSQSNLGIPTHVPDQGQGDQPRHSGLSLGSLNMHVGDMNIGQMRPAHAPEPLQPSIRLLNPSGNYTESTAHYQSHQSPSQVLNRHTNQGFPASDVRPDGFSQMPTQLVRPVAQIDQLTWGTDQCASDMERTSSLPPASILSVTPSQTAGLRPIVKDNRMEQQAPSPQVETMAHGNVDAIHGNQQCPIRINQRERPECIIKDPGSLNLYRCTICETTISADDKLINVDQHLEGSKHKKAKDRLQWKPALDTITSSGYLTSSQGSDGVVLEANAASGGLAESDAIAISTAEFIQRVEGGTSQYSCRLCNQSISGEVNCQQHLQGKTHKKAVLTSRSLSSSSGGSWCMDPITPPGPGLRRFIASGSSASSGKHVIEAIDEIAPDAAKTNPIPDAVPKVSVSESFEGRYTKLGLLGSGGQGRVHKVQDKLEGNSYAIKQIKTSEYRKKKAMAEVKALHNLKHPGIVHYHHCWIEPFSEANDSSSGAKHGKESVMINTTADESISRGDNRIFLFIKMELCKHDLGSYLVPENTEKNKSHLDIFRQVVEAVEFIHSKGIMHRDLKPQNIFFSNENNVKIGDFGLAKEIDLNADDNNSSLIQLHTRSVGTPCYMSPEQFTHEYDKSVDLYALGLILLELLCLFKSSSERAGAFMAIRKDPSDLPKDYSSSYLGLKMLITKLLAKAPKDRPVPSEILKNLYNIKPQERGNTSYPQSLT